MTGIPVVSVLIPTCNYARYLPQAIDSVLQQDCPDCEIIVSDDASSDDSAGVLQRYANRDPRLHIHLQQRNLGMVANWNWCLRQARGRYVKFLFGDDCLLSASAVSTLRDLLDRNPQAVLASSARQVLDAHSRPIALWNRLGPQRVLAGHRVITDCLHQDVNLMGEPSAVMFHRSNATRGFDPTLRQIVDMEMWFHLLRQGDLVHTAQPLCGFRQHPEQQTAKNQGTQIGPKESLIVTARYLDLLTQHLGVFTRQCILHRRLHYSRKRVPRTPEIIALEQKLQARVREPWFLLARLRHRLLRPGQNLANCLLWQRDPKSDIGGRISGNKIKLAASKRGSA